MCVVTKTSCKDNCQILLLVVSSRHKEVQEVSNISTDRFYIRNGTQHPLGSLAISYTETQTNKKHLLCCHLIPEFGFACHSSNHAGNVKPCEMWKPQPTVNSSFAAVSQRPSDSAVSQRPANSLPHLDIWMKLKGGSLQIITSKQQNNNNYKN